MGLSDNGTIVSGESDSGGIGRTTLVLFARIVSVPVAATSPRRPPNTFETRGMGMRSRVIPGVAAAAAELGAASIVADAGSSTAGMPVATMVGGLGAGGASTRSGSIVTKTTPATARAASANRGTR